MNLSNMISDREKVSEGVWIDTTPTSRIKVASTASIHYKKELARILKEKGVKYDFSEMSNEEDLRMTAKLLAKTILVDWEGMTILQNGKEVEYPYSKENAENALYHSDEFRQLVSSQASLQENFQAAHSEILLKNSKSTSSSS